MSGSARRATLFLGLLLCIAAAAPAALAHSGTRAKGAGLTSGTYKATVSVGLGITYASTWKLSVHGGKITGTSTWTCCPGKRTDPLSGTTTGKHVVIVRNCSGHGAGPVCKQTYKGVVSGTGVSGSWSGDGATPGVSTFVLKKG